MEFIFVESEEFKEFKEEMKENLKYFKQCPFKLILSAFAVYLTLVVCIVALG